VRPVDPRPAGLGQSDTPLTESELDDCLDALLNPVLSSRRTAAPLAHALASLPRAPQDFTLHWVDVIGRTNYEMAYQFAAAAPEALAQLDSSAAEAWIIQAMDSYDREGLYHGSQVFKNFSSFAAKAGSENAVRYENVAHMLELFICGLSGRRMKIDAAPVAWTDTDTIYLPPRMAAGTDRMQNFLIYKIIATLLWAQSRYGTFNADLDAAVRDHADPELALTWLNYFETLRLEAQIARTLPGLARDLLALRGNAVDNDARYAPLRALNASVQDSIDLLNALQPCGDVPHHSWMGILRPADASAARTARLAREKSELQAALAALLEEQAKQSTSEAAGHSENEGDRFEVQLRSGDDDIEFELRLDGEPIAPPDHVRNLLDSILQDLGDIPDDYLTPAGDNGERENQHGDNDPADEVKNAIHDESAHFYNEWDHKRRHYRKNWCVLRELDVPPGDDDFVAATLKKYRPQITQLRRSFEMLRGEDRLLKRMKHGDDIDLDAVIAGYADMRSGRELSDRLFTKRHKAERNLAVMFMVDMSGSTKGWINDAEREALVLLSEALEILGDRYAIYGFSGITRKRCEIFRVKRFDEPYSDLVQRRIAGVMPQDYTRMGVAIRHLTALLDDVDARTKLLITLSDGKPDDYSDNYRGEYGIEDTRQALLEAHRAGIKPFCITIDHEARDYLPHMYGAVNWTMVDDVSRLPLKVADIYRRLTT
jgi:nitric oxide reductase NorD protein